MMTLNVQFHTMNILTDLKRFKDKYNLHYA